MPSPPLKTESVASVLAVTSYERVRKNAVRNLPNSNAEKIKSSSDIRRNIQGKAEEGKEMAALCGRNSSA